MKKLFFILCFLPLITSAQNFFLSGRLGTANYQGDLKTSSFSFAQMRLLGSVGGLYDFSEHFTARSYLTFTSLHADDKHGEPGRQHRNLNFTTPIFDWELTGQYNLFSLNERQWTPYAFAGVGLFHFNPYTFDNIGEKYFLKPLSTEGEGFIPGVKNYKRTQFSIPFGIGATYALNEDMRVGIELSYRKTFTDYIDDVSTVYVDENILLKDRGPKAVELAYRGDDVHRGPYPAAGAQRGDSDHKDDYYYIAATYTIRCFFDKTKRSLRFLNKNIKVTCPTTIHY
ncbi:MAG TPA: DUF6089 family protein [Ginsengibacter sp.]|nr:DUF6089 family protein [Ginsengibacter sp.]